MEKEHQLVQEVCEAQKNVEAEDRLIRQYLPYIKSEASKCMHRAAGEDDDEVSIAMFAFHEAVKNYRKDKGAFLSYASVIIKSRIIDYYRKERKHGDTISIDEPQYGDEGGATVLEREVLGRDDLEEFSASAAAGEEIREFCMQLSGYGLTLNDIAENCPKQERTLKACRQALLHARTEGRIMDSFLEHKRIPMKQLSEGSGVERKTLERHRKYLAAVLLAFTNGYEIIRGHLKQMQPKERREGI